MPLLLPRGPMALNAFDASWLHQPIGYLVVAAVCLMIALHFLRRALAPIGALLHAAAAAAVVAFAAVFALAMVVIAALQTAH